MIESRHLDDLTREFGVPLQLPRLAQQDFPDWAALADVVAQLIPELCAERPIIAISGSQGSGKSTLAKVMASRMSQLPVVSLDDFYLTKAQRQQLAVTVHPLLATRGVPGTHDHAWLARVLNAVKQGQQIEVPIFDKGADDRSGSQVLAGYGLLVEGWCLGVQGQDAAALASACNSLEEVEDAEGRWRAWVNEQLINHYLPLWTAVDFWIHLRVPSFAQILRWRSEQEQALAPAQRMSPAQLERFIQHYERLTRQLWQQPPSGPGLLVELDADHEIADIAPIPFR